VPLSRRRLISCGGGCGKLLETLNRLDDILALDLDILLVAINPATPSATSGHHFATPTNAFWRLLHASGLTTRLYLPAEAGRLLEDGIGLVSLVDRPTKMASEVRRDELRAGARRLATKVERWRPRTLALLGLTLLPYVLLDADEPGPGLKRATFGGAAVFVVPNPSGRNRAYPGLAGKLPWYQELARTRDRARRR
jgi:double-stranded uracil-DNA glycosylase